MRIRGLDERRRQWRAAIARLRDEHAAKAAELRALPPPVDRQDAINAAGREARDLVERGEELDDDARALEDRHARLHARVLNLKRELRLMMGMMEGGKGANAKRQVGGALCRVVTRCGGRETHRHLLTSTHTSTRCSFIAPHTERVAQLDSSKMRRLHALNEQRPGLKALAEWVERAKRDGAFKGPVHGPIGVEIALDDALSHARPVEHVRERESGRGSPFS